MKPRKKKFRAVLALGLAASLLLSYLLVTQAVWDETTAVHIVPADIEASTLVVGTHLIHLSALSDSIYEIAQQSAEESGQTSVYYKSELAKGAWFDITSATTLADITTSGSPVSDSVIAALFFTHHTKSDGVTYDLRTGLAVDPRNIYNPYDLESMEELFPLKTHYDTLRETQADSKSGKAKIERIATFFATAVITPETIAQDNNLAALQVYYDVLNANDAGAVEKNAVQAVMDAADASRRAVVFGIIESALSAYLDELSKVSDSEDAEGNSVEGAAPDTNLQSAVSDSLNNIRSSKIKWEGKMLDPGTTVSTGVNYTLSTQLIQDAVARNHSYCDRDVIQLVALQNIMDGIISTREHELALLDGALLPQSTGAYTSGLTAGESGEYAAAVAQNSAQVLLRSIAKNNTSLLNSYRTELQFFIEAKTQREAAADAVSYIDQRLTLTQGWYTTPPRDAFRDGAVETLDAHVEFLTRLKRGLAGASGTEELDALVSEKAELQTEMMGCLDNNDLLGAQAAEQKIAALDAKIRDLAGRSSSEVAGLQSRLSDLQQEIDEAEAAGDLITADRLESEAAALKAKISDVTNALASGSLGAQIASLKSQGLAAVADGDGTAALDAVNSLGNLAGLDSGLVFPALKDLHQAMAKEKNVNGSKVFDSGLIAAEDLILNNSEAYAAALRTQPTAKDLTTIADDFFSSESSASKGLFTPTGDGGGRGTGSASGSGSGIGSGVTGSGTQGSGGIGGSGAAGSSGGTGTGTPGSPGATGSQGPGDTNGSGTDGSDGTGTDGSGTDGTAGPSGGGTDGSGGPGSTGTQGPGGPAGTGTDGTGNSGGTGTDGTGGNTGAGPSGGTSGAGSSGGTSAGANGGKGLGASIAGYIQLNESDYPDSLLQSNAGSGADGSGVTGGIQGGTGAQRPGGTGTVNPDGTTGPGSQGPSDSTGTGTDGTGDSSGSGNQGPNGTTGPGNQGSGDGTSTGADGSGGTTGDGTQGSGTAGPGGDVSGDGSGGGTGTDGTGGDSGSGTQGPGGATGPSGDGSFLGPDGTVLPGVSGGTDDGSGGVPTSIPRVNPPASSRKAPDLSNLTTNPVVNLMALEMYYIETGSQEALSLMNTITRREISLGNPLVFVRYNDGGREYLPLTALRTYTGMRYVWNRTTSLGTLAKGATYYGFTAFSDSVKRGRDTEAVDNMSQTAKFQTGVIHVFEEYTYQEYGVEAIYLSGDIYGVLCDREMLTQALDLFARFLA